MTGAGYRTERLRASRKVKALKKITRNADHFTSSKEGAATTRGQNTRWFL